MKKYISLVVLLICFIPAIIPLFHAGFPVTDDGGWMIIRFSAFYEVLRHGQFPVRFLFRLNNGFGYPVADFLYPLFMYLGVLIHVVGVDFISAVKILLGVSVVCSGIFSFVWLKKVFPTRGAFFGALMYVYFPYHMFDVYSRGSVGEVLALAIVPFILWQIERKKVILTAIGIALLITAHNTLALLFFPVIILYFIMRKMDTRFIILSMVLGLGLSCFFWIPALFDQQYTVFSQSKISDVSNYFLTQKNITLIGFPLILILIQSAYFWFSNPNSDILIFLCISFIAFLFILPVTQILWKVSPFTPLIQFPWRLLSLIVLSSSFLFAYVITQTKRFSYFIWAFYLLLLFFSALPYILTTQYQYFSNSYYSTNQDSTTVKNEYMPKWVNKPSLSADNAKELIITSGKGTVVSFEKNGSGIIAIVLLTTKGTVQLPVVYFPGVNVSIDTKIVQAGHTSSGLTYAAIPAGKHLVKLFYRETLVQLFADAISIASIIGVVTLVVKKKYV